MAKNHRIPPLLGWCRKASGKVVNWVECLNHHGDAFNAIEYPHDKIHRGLVFACSIDFASVLDDGYARALILVGSIPAHLTWGASMGGDFLASLYETPAFSDPGTPAGVFNHNRVGSDASSWVEGNKTTVFSGPIITSVGTGPLDGDFIPGGSGGKAVGATGDGRHEFLLNPNTYYLASMQNISGQTRRAHISLDWYEHELGDVY